MNLESKFSCIKKILKENFFYQSPLAEKIQIQINRGYTIFGVKWASLRFGTRKLFLKSAHFKNTVVRFSVLSKL